MEMFDDDNHPKPLGNKLFRLVNRLEKKGVSKERIKRSANRLGLEDCSYGSLRYSLPATGYFWGFVGGLAASYACDGLCDALHVETAKRVFSDIAALTMPTLYISSAAYCEREQKDWQFYNHLQRIFRDRLAEK